MNINNKLIILTICKNIIKLFVVIALIMKKLYLVNAKLYIPLGDFENVKYIIYLLLLLFFVNKNGKYTIRLVSFLSEIFLTRWSPFRVPAHLRLNQ